MTQPLVTDEEIIKALKDEFGHDVYYVYDVIGQDRHENVFFIYYGKIEESNSSTVFIETLYIEHIRVAPEDDVRGRVIQTLPKKLTFKKAYSEYRVSDDYKSLIQIDTYEVTRKLRKCGC